jgi:hypothetical protein
VVLEEGRSERRLDLSEAAEHGRMIDPELGRSARHPARLGDSLNETEVVPGEMLEGFGHGGLREFLAGGTGLLRRPARE